MAPVAGLTSKVAPRGPKCQRGKGLGRATSFLPSCPRVAHPNGSCVVGISRILSLDRRTLGDAKVVVSLPAVQTGPISLAVVHR